MGLLAHPTAAVASWGRPIQSSLHYSARQKTFSQTSVFFCPLIPVSFWKRPYPFLPIVCHSYRQSGDDGRYR